MRDTLIEFMDSLRDYVAESGKNIAHDERDSSEFVDIFLSQGKSLPMESVSVSSPLDKLHKWCENEGWKEGSVLLVRTDNMKPVIVDCNRKTSVSGFKDHIDER